MNGRQLPVPGRTFIDTSGYVALIDDSDVNHMLANALADIDRVQFFTTNFVIAETHALLLRRLGRGIAARYVEQTDHSSTEVIRIDENDEHRAREIIFRQTDKDYSFTDATSFAVMERLRIGEAFTFDRHFLQFGFAVPALID